MDILEAYKKEFSDLGSGQDKDLRNARAKSLKTFLARGFPTPRTEDWRYADLSLLKAGHLEKTGGQTPSEKIKPLTGWPLLVVENGNVVKAPKNMEAIEIKTLPGKMKRYAHSGLFDSPLERLNLAFADRGLGLVIKNGAEVEGLEIVFLNAAGENQAFYLRNLIEVEDKAKARLFIREEGQGHHFWTSQATNFYLGKKAGLEIIRDFKAARSSLLTFRDYAALESSANFKLCALMSGLPSLRYEIEAALLGEGAKAQLSGGMLAGRDNTIDVATRVHHLKGGTESSQTFKGVAGAGGKSAFQGRVRVEEDAQKIEAHQNCNNLILDKTGEANVKPELLIFADDVVCSHGATVGEIDQEALFYMMQRGLSEKQARSILIHAFLGEVLEKIENQEISDYLTAKSESWMEGNLS